MNDQPTAANLSTTGINLEFIREQMRKEKAYDGPSVVVMTYEVKAELLKQIPEQHASDPLAFAPQRLTGLPVEAYPTRWEAANRARELANSGVRVALVTSVGSVPDDDAGEH